MLKQSENVWDPTFNFWDTKGTSLEVLTPERQYGLTLALLLVSI